MRKKIYLKVVAVYLSLSLLLEILFPTLAFALTGGPAQPESSSFTPAGTSDMVNLFTGDYNYNIPLLDVGGYPINISYQSGISMDQEASWVGLGWNINPGAINRNMRGLPDDFNGDEVVKEFNIKPNRTYGLNAGFGAEIAGFEGLSLNFGLGVKYNNYTGVGFEQSVNAAFSSGDKGKTQGTASLGLRSSADGLDISPSVSASVINDRKEKADTKFGASIGSSFNSRSGLKALSVNTSIQQGHIAEATDKNVNPDNVDKFSAGSDAIGTGTSISMANNTYVPSISMPMTNFSVNASFKMGVTIFSVDGSLDISGYYSEQRLAEKRQSINAFGFMYTQNGQAGDKVLLDFNREKEGAFTKNTPTLPLTNFSYDVYAVSGQGVGGVFRPFRSDLGYVFDSRTTTTSDALNVGAEYGGGNLLKGGVDISVNNVNSSSGKWSQDNAAADILQYKAKGDDELYEPFYFKEQGEKNVDSDSKLYNDIGADEPVRIGLSGNGAHAHATAEFVTGESENNLRTRIPEKSYRSKRQTRNQLFSFITHEEYEQSGLYKSLYKDNLGVPPIDKIFRLNDPLTNADKIKKHIAEITTTKTDGSRYVYGIPAYNTKQKEVTFNMGGKQVIPTPANGLITYVAPDNTKENGNGVDNYFSSTELPPYAHTYLLTAVLSPDYVDITGDGLTTDDYGTYTKFSYTKTTKNSIYHWRVPYGHNTANYNEGLRSDAMDDQGNYIYGEKEIWILDKIETKNYVAVFTCKNRADGYDVIDENGGIGINTSPLLKKISLYSRPDYDKNFSTNTAVPIKEAHFVYDYSLCPGTLNNVHTNGGGNWSIDPECESTASSTQNGKLTLKQIYFTYGKSYKAKLNPYTFNYCIPDPANNTVLLNNYAYGLKDYDRWGNYKHNVTDGSETANSEYPYVGQNKAQADLYASAWTLTKIGLPSGGTINVEYESDDYAFVQDKNAMQMFKITGVGEYDSNSEAVKTKNPTAQNDLKGGDYLFFKLQEPVPVGTSDTQFREQYLKGITDVYFRVLANVAGNSLPDYEYVSGYAKLFEGCGLSHTNVVDNHYTYGYIQLENTELDENKPAIYNPISKAALHFARINTPKKSYGYDFSGNPDPDPSKVSLRSVLNSLMDANLIKNVVESFQGPNHSLYDNPSKGYGKKIALEKSWVRLLNPNQNKLGGGVRVKKITISDEWGSMLGGTPDHTKDFSYGQEYDYTKLENGKVISSGVASYEPMAGGDENPFRLPVAYSEKMKLAADLDYYKEEPFGETFFPSPGVGYSKVTVKNLQRHVDDDPAKALKVKRHATGYVVNEFYTCRDFPVITKRTPVETKTTSNVGQALKSLLKLKVKDYMTASQGFSIELNDMHGKQKANWVYAEGQLAPISGVEYKYKANGNKLINEAAVINKDGSIKPDATVGIDYDFVADMREQSTDVLNIGIGMQLYSMLIGFIPIVIPPILPVYASEQTRFRSASVTKVINRFGLLDETIAYDLGSKVSTQNLAYDSETGDVVLTKTKNDFNDEVFAFNYPAHLGYDRMGPGYKNVDVIVTQAPSADGKITDDNALKILVPGDEIQILPAPTVNWKDIGQTNFWINASKDGKQLYAVGRSGSPVAFEAASTIKVIRSGRRNQQGLPIGSFTSLISPIDKNNDKVTDGQLTSFDNTYKVLSASASEYSEVWRNYCECGINPNDPNGPTNPYVLGLLGNWRAKKSYTFLSDRKQTKVNDNSDIRKDGTYAYFKQFWSPALGKDWTAPTNLYLTDGKTPNPLSEWTWTSEVTEFSPFGPELENKDALNRYSSAVYGYNNALPIAVASNAKYKEIAFDGFEDYDFKDCMNDHFSFEPVSSDVAWAVYNAITSREGGPSNYGVFDREKTISIANDKSHSGKRSIKISAKGSVSIMKNISDCPVNPPPPPAPLTGRSGN